MATAWCFFHMGSVSEGLSVFWRQYYFSMFGKENEPVEVKKRGPISLRRNCQIWRNETLTGLY